MCKYAVLALFASTGFGQTPTEPNVDLTFHLTQVKTTQELQEVATAIRSIANIRQVLVDEAQKSLALHAPADQIALAQWLYNELDQTPVRPSSEYRVPGNANDVVRIFHPANARTPQQVVEIATLVRSISNIPLVVTPGPRAVVMRGTTAEMALADWLFTEIDKHDPAAPLQHSASPEYQATDGRNGENVVRIFYLGYAPTAQDFVEAATLTRSIADLRQVFQYNAVKAMAIRGTAGQVAMAEWLFNEIDRPAKEQVAPAEYRVPDSRDDIVSVFYITRAKTAQELVTIATQIRTETKVQRAFMYNAPKAVAVRGTSEQIARAEQMSRQQ